MSGLDPTSIGGADGIRTHDLLDAIEARSQLRHGPTVNHFLVYHIRVSSDSRLRPSKARPHAPTGTRPSASPRYFPLRSRRKRGEQICYGTVKTAHFSSTTSTLFLSKRTILDAAKILKLHYLIMFALVTTITSFFLRRLLSSLWTNSLAILYARLSSALLNVSKEQYPMSAESSSNHFRGVLCRHCGKPVRVPGIVLRKDTENRGHHDADDVQFHLISRVFVLRCRSCERESIYAIDQIVDCTFAQAQARGGLAEAAV